MEDKGKRSPTSYPSPFPTIAAATHSWLVAARLLLGSYTPCSAGKTAPADGHAPPALPRSLSGKGLAVFAPEFAASWGSAGVAVAVHPLLLAPCRPRCKEVPSRIGARGELLLDRSSAARLGCGRSGRACRCRTHWARTVAAAADNRPTSGTVATAGFRPATVALGGVVTLECAPENTSQWRGRAYNRPSNGRRAEIGGGCPCCRLLSSQQPRWPVGALFRAADISFLTSIGLDRALFTRRISRSARCLHCRCQAPHN